MLINTTPPCKSMGRKCMVQCARCRPRKRETQRVIEAATDMAHRLGHEFVVDQQKLETFEATLPPRDDPTP